MDIYKQYTAENETNKIFDFLIQSNDQNISTNQTTLSQINSQTSTSSLLHNYLNLDNEEIRYNNIKNEIDNDYEKENENNEI